MTDQTSAETLARVTGSVAATVTTVETDGSTSSTETYVRPASVNPTASAADREIIGEALAARRERRFAWTGEEIVDLATAILRSVSFADTDRAAVQAIIRTLATISELDGDAEALEEHSVAGLVVAVGAAAGAGYTLPAFGTVERISELLARYAADVEVERNEHGATRIGTVTVAAHDETVDHGTPWFEGVEIPAQTVDLWLSVDDPSGRRVGVTFEAVSVRRESGAQLGGVDVVRTVDETPQATTRQASAYAYAAARAIATTGKLFGGEVILARGVRLVATRYVHVGSDPASLAWSFEVPADR